MTRVVKGVAKFQKGGGRLPNSGRAPGTPNKQTADVRATIKLIAERKILQVEGWLERVAKKDPGKAMDLYTRLIEFHVPKLQRTEMTGLDGGAITIEATQTDEKL